LKSLDQLLQYPVISGQSSGRRLLELVIVPQQKQPVGVNPRTDGGLLQVVMEYMDGGSITNLLQAHQSKKLELSEAQMAGYAARNPDP